MNLLNSTDWSSKIQIRASPQSGNTIYVYAFAGVLAWDTASGHQRWFYSMSGAGTLSAPAVVNGTVYVGTADRLIVANGGMHFQSDDKLYALDAASGSE